MANPNNAWKYRGARERMETRAVNWANEDEVRAEMVAKWPAPAFEVRKVNRTNRRAAKAWSELVAFKN